MLRTQPNLSFYKSHPTYICSRLTKNNNMDQFNTNYLTEQQVADMYQVSTRTLHNLRKDGKLTVNLEYFYLGKQIRYKPIQLQEYFETSAISFIGN